MSNYKRLSTLTWILGALTLHVATSPILAAPRNEDRSSLLVAASTPADFETYRENFKHQLFQAGIVEDVIEGWVWLDPDHEDSLVRSFKTLETRGSIVVPLGCVEEAIEFLRAVVRPMIHDRESGLSMCMARAFLCGRPDLPADPDQVRAFIRAWGKAHVVSMSVGQAPTHAWEPRITDLRVSWEPGQVDAIVLIEILEEEGVIQDMLRHIELSINLETLRIRLLSRKIVWR